MSASRPRFTVREPWRESSTHGFGRTLGYGAIAALGLPVFVLATGRSLETQPAITLYAVAATAGYLAVLARGARTRVAVAVAAFALGLVVRAIFVGMAPLFLVLSLGVALVRSGLLFERRSLRGAGIEAVVLVVALVSAHLLSSPGLLAAALAVWGWFVAQSFYFLLGGFARRRTRAQADPFETARSRLEELLAE
jgi:hypothetical protein